MTNAKIFHSLNLQVNISAVYVSQRLIIHSDPDLSSGLIKGILCIASLLYRWDLEDLQLVIVHKKYFKTVNIIVII